tara:strand:- start:478 stop:744 length:267 start_codon:yes stop_codon:yes gene_type:complete
VDSELETLLAEARNNIEKTTGENIEEELWNYLIESKKELERANEVQKMWKENRDIAIKNLYSYGKPAALIGKIAGLSRVLIHRIVKET